MKLVKIVGGSARPIFRLDRLSGKVFWHPREIPTLVDRIKSEEQQDRLAWLKNGPSKRPR